MSTYYNNLIQTIIDHSKGLIWDEAVLEWEIEDCVEDSSLTESCICGKEHLKYLYTIHNPLTNSTLSPIGSSCIRKFKRDDLDAETTVTEQMFKLLHAVENDEYLDLSSELFSRRLLQKLHDEGAFKANQYNHFDGSESYRFMLQMFNKRDKKSITTAQNKRIKAILLNDIKPHLQEKLNNKIKH